MAHFWQAFKLPPAEEWPSKRVIASYVLDWVIIVYAFGLLKLNVHHTDSSAVSSLQLAED